MSLDLNVYLPGLFVLIFFHEDVCFEFRVVFWLRIFVQFEIYIEQFDLGLVDLGFEEEEVDVVDFIELELLWG